MQLNITYFYDSQDSIICFWVCLYFEVLSLVTLDAVFGSPCRAVWSVFVRRMQPQRRGPGLLFFYFARALLYESEGQSLREKNSASYW